MIWLWLALGLVQGIVIGGLIALAVGIGRTRAEVRTVLAAVISMRKAFDPQWAARWEANLQRSRERDGE